LRLREGGTTLLHVPVDTVLAALSVPGGAASQRRPVPAPAMTVAAVSESIAVQVVFRWLSGHEADTGPVLTDWAGTLDLRFAPAP
jgi:hypothetical protein